MFKPLRMARTKQTARKFNGGVGVKKREAVLQKAAKSPKQAKIKVEPVETRSTRAQRKVVPAKKTIVKSPRKPKRRVRRGTVALRYAWR